MSLKDLGLNLLCVALFALTVALATTGIPGKADAGPCWPAWCQTTTSGGCPNNSAFGSTGCTNCSGNTLSFCAASNLAWDFCWVDNCCRGTATNRSGSVCFCVPSAQEPCGCSG